jgi:predicted phosphodiesterase
LPKDSVLVVGDTHFPFVKKGYLDFCLDIQRRVKCRQVVHIGDLCDNHAISYHEHDPNGRSPIDEMVEADKHLKQWFKAFPSLFLCKANHDLVDRKARTEGLPDRLFRPFREIWGLPKGWKNEFNFEIDGVMYQHGTGYSGETAHIKAAYNNRQSCVIGHTHSFLGGGYIANEKDKIFGVNCGCGIDRHSYAMNYGRDFKSKPIIGCAVITDKGRYWQTFPMEL